MGSQFLNGTSARYKLQAKLVGPNQLEMWRYDALCTAGFVDEVVFATATLMVRVLNVSHQGAAQGAKLVLFLPARHYASTRANKATFGYGWTSFVKIAMDCGLCTPVPE